jgi:hypothetical protein
MVERRVPKASTPEHALTARGMTLEHRHPAICDPAAVGMACAAVLVAQCHQVKLANPGRVAGEFDY